MNVLEIDDNIDIIKYVDLIVSSMGHTFSSATNGREGLKMIEDNKYDLVFLDLSMPEFSGIDVIDELVAKDLIKSQVIVVFTASSKIGEDAQGLLEKGVHSYLTKPVDVDILMSKINEISKK